jgi:hypothetical protein
MKLYKSTEENIRKWTLTGLLDELSPEAIGECADSLENLATILIDHNKDEPVRTEWFCGTIIPIMRCLYNENHNLPIDKIPSAARLYNDYLEYTENDSYLDMREQDEPKYVSDYVNQLVKKLKWYD